MTLAPSALAVLAAILRHFPLFESVGVFHFIEFVSETVCVDVCSLFGGIVMGCGRRMIIGGVGFWFGMVFGIGNGIVSHRTKKPT